jgi:hypothetical protein
MKTILFIICMSGFITLVAGTPGSGADPAASTYTLVRSDQNISVYAKWIPLNETVSTRKVKAVFSCSAEVNDVIRLISDDAAVTQWMSNVADFNRLKSVSAGEWFSYLRYGLPWPLSDQDCIVHYVVEEMEGGKSARVLVTGIPDYIPVNSGISRISHLECEWLIHKTGDNRVVIEYSQYSKQPPKFPRKITDPLVQKALIRSLAAFRAIVEKQ